MVTVDQVKEQMAKQEYKFGFTADVEMDVFPAGINEEVVRAISRWKEEPEWLLEWRLKSYRYWTAMKEPKWANITYGPIDYQGISYFAAPKNKGTGPTEMDPEIKKLYDRLGIPLVEQERLAGVAVDAVLDSVSVATTFKDKLASMGIIFSSFSEAVKEHPDLVRKWLGFVVPQNDNFFAALNSAVFSDGSFAYIPPGVRCPMELSTYFRINAANTGQFERTLIIADKGSYVSYLEGCVPFWEEVSTGEAMVTITEIGLHDTVLNSKGRKSHVDKLMTRYFEGDLIDITPQSSGNRFSVTPEHPVLAVQRERILGSRSRSTHWPKIDRKKLATATPEFVPAGKLKKGDYAVFPISQVSRDNPKLTDDFLRLLGYYVAEGCATKFNGYDAVELCFGSHEEDLLRKVPALIERVTGRAPSVTFDMKRHGAYVVVYSKELAALLVKHGGKYAVGKRFSKAVMELPPERQKLAFDAYIEGDGSIGIALGKSGPLTRVRACTVSRQLAFQLQEMLARQGVYAGIHPREATDERMKDGHVIHHKKRYWVCYSRNAGSRTVRRRPGYFLVPIRRTARKPFAGYVYNIETKAPHTYLVKGFAVHNCTAPMRDEHQLHAAVVELIALDDAELKYSTIQNWYPGDKNGKGGIYNFVTKRGRAVGKNSKLSWTQVETGSAITWKYPSCWLEGDNAQGEFYSVAVCNNHQQADTGTKMIHIGKNTRSTIISKGISAGFGQNTYRGQVKVMRGATGARNYSQCDSLLVGDKCGAHTFPYIEVNEPTATLEHEASTSKIGEDQLFYCQQRGITPEDATNMIVNGFCKKVFNNLPMEFAVEAQKLIVVSLNLEGTVG